MKKINAVQCKTLSKPGLYRADDTLYLSVQESGRRSWIQRVMIDGRRHDIGLGSFPVVSLAKARKRAFRNREKIADGINPLLEKRRSSMPTFRVATERTHKSFAPSWKNEQHARSWMQVVQKHTFPILADLPVDQISQQDVLNVLEPIWTTRPETARRVRGRIRSVLRFCEAHGFVDRNVAGDAIDGALPAMPKVKEHLRALPYSEAPAAFKAIETKVTTESPRLCLLFILLTAARSNEAREATWGEIDLKSATWEIPASRMKAGKIHRVPLSKSALAVLDQAVNIRDGSDLIFPSPAKSGHPMANNTLKKHMVKVGLWERTVVHGFRTSFRTWAAECTDIPREVCEMALAHTVGTGVEQAYSRSDLLEKRVRLMQQWSRFLF